MERLPLLLACVLTLVPSATAAGVPGVSEFTAADGWFGAVGEVTTITFTEFPHDTFITDQYENLGILFLDGDDNIGCCCRFTFPNDGAGLDGNKEILLEFTSPMNWLAADFPGSLGIFLYSEGEFIYCAGFGTGGPGHFGGVASNTTFDSAVLLSQGQVALDDLHFGATLPGDVNHDGDVDVADLVEVIIGWGACAPQGYCAGDMNADGGVGVEDLISVLVNWD